jgi:hypothetical protein
MEMPIIMFSKPWMFGEDMKIQIYNLLLHRLILILSVLGGIWGTIKSRLERFVSVYTICFAGLYLIFVPTDRYAYQLMFLLMVIASSIIIRLVDIMRGFYIEKKIMPDDLDSVK